MSEKEILESVAESYIKGIVYTIIKDFHDIFYGTSYDQEIVQRVSSAVYEAVSSKEVKFRKPTERKTTVKQKKISLKSSIVKSEDITWYKHEDDPQYSYTKDIYLSSGYFPLASTDDKTIVGAIGEEGIRKLTNTERNILKNKNLKTSSTDIFED